MDRKIKFIAESHGDDPEIRLTIKYQNQPVALLLGFQSFLSGMGVILTEEEDALLGRVTESLLTRYDPEAAHYCDDVLPGLIKQAAQNSPH